MLLRFVIPKNYKYQMKFLGFINYTTILIDTVIAILLLGLLSIFIKSIEIKIYIFVSLYFPVILFSIFGIGNENIVYVTKYIIKYIIKQKVYLYNK